LPKSIKKSKIDLGFFWTFELAARARATEFLYYDIQIDKGYAVMI
jgi:hypothetical protein